MILPDYWLKRPRTEIDIEIYAEFDRLFGRIKTGSVNSRIEYTIQAAKWQFLCYLADQGDVVLHGTGDPAIKLFEPRPSKDLSEFGAQTAVYAAGDGLWAMFFAILDREHHPMVTSNACIRLVDEAGLAS